MSVYIVHLICCSRQVLLLQLRLIPEHGNDGEHVLSTWLSLNSRLSQHCTVELFNWLCSLIHHAATQRPRVVCTLLKLLVRGFSLVKEQNKQNKKSTDAAKNHNSSPNAHLSWLYLFRTPCRCGTHGTGIHPTLRFLACANWQHRSRSIQTKATESNQNVTPTDLAARHVGSWKTGTL